MQNKRVRVSSTSAFASTLMVLCCLLMAVAASAQEQQQPAKPDPKPAVKAAELPRIVVVEFYADWCAVCRELMPKLTEAKSAFQGKTVLFARFDMTDDFTREQASYMAAFAGLEDVYRRGNGRTGVVALVDAKTKKLLGLIGRDKSIEEIKAMLNDAVSKAGS